MVFKLNNLKTILGAVKGAVKGEIKYVVKGKVLCIDALGMEINQPYTHCRLFAGEYFGTC